MRDILDMRYINAGKEEHIRNAGGHVDGRHETTNGDGDGKVSRKIV